MPVSFHSHSGQYCLHAKGSLEQVVEEAIRKGFTAYGLSEHMPRYGEEDLYPEESHLHPTDLEKNFTDYVQEARRLQRKYQGVIQLFVGMETEFILPVDTSHESGNVTVFAAKESVEKASRLIQSLVDKFQLDYIVGSLHHVYKDMIDFDQERLDGAETHCFRLLNSTFPSWTPTEAFFHTYFDQQYLMLSLVQPTVVGHFDLCRMWRSDAIISAELWQKIDRNVDKIVEYGGIVELNSRAWKKGLTDAYPMRDILKRMIEKRCKFTLSDDSHGPPDVGMHYDKLYNYLKQMNIQDIWIPTRGEMRQIQTHDFWSREWLKSPGLSDR